MSYYYYLLIVIVILDICLKLKMSDYADLCPVNCPIEVMHWQSHDLLIFVPSRQGIMQFVSEHAICVSWQSYCGRDTAMNLIWKFPAHIGDSRFGRGTNSLGSIWFRFLPPFRCKALLQWSMSSWKTNPSLTNRKLLLLDSLCQIRVLINKTTAEPAFRSWHQQLHNLFQGCVIIV